MMAETSHALVSYEDACRAISETLRIEQAKGWRDYADAIGLLARRAADRKVVAECTEIRLRSTRKIGEIMHWQAESGERAGPGRRWDNGVADTPLTLDDQGIDKNLAKQARRLFSWPEDEFEQFVSKTCDAIAKAPVKVMQTASKRAETSERIAPDVREAIKDTPLDSDTSREYLAGLEAEDQREHISLLLNDDALQWEPDEVAVKRLEDLTLAWNVAEEPERRAFMLHSMGIIGEWVTLEEATVLFNKARKKLGWTMDQMDAEAGLAERHASKLLIQGDKPAKKHLGPSSMMKLGRAMGVSHLFRLPGVG